MTDQNEQTPNVETIPGVAAVFVPEHLHREIQTFVEQLMAEESDVEAYSMFLGDILSGTNFGSKGVATPPKSGSRGDMLDLGYDG